MQKNMTGYDINKEFNHGLIDFWYAKHSQIYPELKKLVNEGLIAYKIEISGDVLEKKVYSITDAGKSDFIEWLCQDVEIEPTPKDVFRLRMFFSQYIDRQTIIPLIDSQIKQHQKKLQRLLDTNHCFDDIPHPYSKEAGDYLVLQGAIMRENYYLDWLEKCKQFYQTS